MPGLPHPGPRDGSVPSAPPAGRARRRGLRAAAGTLVLLPLLAGCNIDKSQWRDYPSMETSTTTSTRTSGGGTTVVQQEQVVAGLGVIGGADPGAHRSDEARVVLNTDPATCWVLVVDGYYNRGCGPASFTDTHGIAAGRVTKLTGTTPVQLQLLTESGETIDSGQVISSDHYVTVRN